MNQLQFGSDSARVCDPLCRLWWENNAPKFLSITPIMSMVVSQKRGCSIFQDFSINRVSDTDSEMLFEMFWIKEYNLQHYLYSRHIL